MENIKEPRETWWSYRWKEKLIAIVLAVIIWIFVNQAIVISKTVPNIPVRILNIPQEKVISGLLPNGVYQKRVKLTLTGTRHVIENIEPGDLEIVLDATLAPDEWPVELTNKNLVSLNPDIDLGRHIKDVSQTDLVIHLSQLVNADVPLYVVPPKGTPPQGYALVDISPCTLLQSMTGPEEEMSDLERSGVALEFDLSRLTKEELDKLPNSGGEVIFPVPSTWKKVKVPWLSSGMVPLNSSDASKLEILFIKEEAIPIELPIPLLVSTPFSSAPSHILPGPLVEQKNGLSYLNQPLRIEGTSQTFAELVAPHLSIVINGQETHGKELLWNLVVLASEELENQYVDTFFNHLQTLDWAKSEVTRRLRAHFRTYLESMCITTADGKPLELKMQATPTGIEVL